MSSGFPIHLDSFVNPSGSNHLSDIAVLHSLQHTNVNNALRAVQERIGIISSSISSSIDYEIHNTLEGHNHDGINSRQIAIGPPPYGGTVYSGGIFAFSSSTPLGAAIDSFNTFFVSSSAKPIFKINSIDYGTPSIINITGSVVSGSLSGSQLTISFDGLAETSRNLILLAGVDGPFESYTSSYRTTGYLNGTSIFPTESIWYEDSLLTKKIISNEINYNARHQITKSIWIVYNTDGISPRYMAIDEISYSGIKEVLRHRTVL